MRSVARLALAVSTLLLGAAAASANTINITESGDFTDHGNIGTLGAGANTIIGTVSGADKSDIFDLTLPSGFTITSASLTISNYNQGAGGTGIVPAVVVDNTIVLQQGTFSGGTFLYSGPFPGPVNIEVTAQAPDSTDTGPLGQGPFTDDPGSMSYSLTYNVAQVAPAVPLPPAASAGALTLAILGLAGLARRRPRATSPAR